MGKDWGILGVLGRDTLWMLAQPSATSVPPRGCAVSQKLEDAQAGPRGLIKHPPGTSLPWKTPEGFSSFFFFSPNFLPRKWLHRRERAGKLLPGAGKRSERGRGGKGLSWLCSLLPRIPPAPNFGHFAGAWLGGRWDGMGWERKRARGCDSEAGKMLPTRLAAGRTRGRTNWATR